MSPGLAIALSAISAILSSLITGYLLKLIEHKREIRTAGISDVARKRALDRYEALREVVALSASLLHNLRKIDREDFVWIGAALRDMQSLRNVTRRETLNLGTEQIKYIESVTDRVRDSLAEDVRVETDGKGSISVDFVPRIALNAQDVLDCMEEVGFLLHEFNSLVADSS
jgi:hypothetical protein